MRTPWSPPRLYVIGFVSGDCEYELGTLATADVLLELGWELTFRTYEKLPDTLYAEKSGALFEAAVLPDPVPTENPGGSLVEAFRIVGADGEPTREQLAADTLLRLPDPDPEGTWLPGRWWRVLDTDGRLYCESSDEQENRRAAERVNGRLQRTQVPLLRERWVDVERVPLGDDGQELGRHRHTCARLRDSSAPCDCGGYQ